MSKYYKRPYTGARQLVPRVHKGIKFHPRMRGINRYSVEKWMAKRGVQHTNYYRIYRYKGRGYVLFIGPQKPSHGGFRHKPRKFKTPREFQVPEASE